MKRLLSIIIALLFSATVTFSLFFLMQFLIANDQTEPEVGERRRIADITLPEPDLEIQQVEPKPEEIEEPEELPELPDQVITLEAPEGPAIQVQTVDINIGDLGGEFSLSASDAEYLPIVIIPPTYPPRAAQNATEGWCQVMFTVTENGSVIDAVVVDNFPSNVFDSASLRAVSRFKFNPRTEDGVPIQTQGVQYVFTYEMEPE